MNPLRILKAYRAADRALNVLDEGRADWDSGNPQIVRLYMRKDWWERALGAARDLALELPITSALRRWLTVKNWKTTLGGISAILAIVVKVINGGGLSETDIAVIVAGIGLILAKDHGVTGGTVRQ